MLQVLASIAPVLIGFALWADQAHIQSAPSHAPRPVTDTTKPPRLVKIALSAFSFQEPAFLHAVPGLASIDGEPTHLFFVLLAPPQDRANR